jgi:hypothetical protein
MAAHLYWPIIINLASINSARALGRNRVSFKAGRFAVKALEKTMASRLTVLLLIVIAFQLALVLRRLDRAALISAATKIHIREAKEEHWAQLHAIRAILLEQLKADERVPEKRKDLLADTPAHLGEEGHWWYHMPNNYLEVDWRGYNVTPDQSQLRGRREAAERVRNEAGLKNRLAEL